MDRRSFLKHTAAGVAGAGILPFLKHLPAQAATGDTIVVVTATTVNSMDIHRTGTNRPSYMNAVNLYDRLLSFGTKQLPDGSFSYDYSVLEGELAESWTVADDEMSVLIKLKPDVIFQDGSPVTAEDVKWSLDRAVSVGGFPTVQMKAGSLIKPEQFEIVDEKSIRIKFIRKSKLTLPDLAVPVPMIINAKVAREHATADDPWATEYLHRNPAGSGAFKLERWDPGQQVVYSRFDDWKSGPLPGVKRVIVREVPSQATRRALIERGNVQVSFNIPHKDAKELADNPKLNVIGTPIENSMYCVGLNLNFEPFKDKKVRQAVAYGIPYAEIFKTAAYGRGVPMWGGKSFTPSDITWPQPFPYDTDLDKAKELLSQTAFKDGFEVPLSFNLSFADWSEPTVLLIQESLAKIGIKCTIDKIPGANYRTAALVEKKLPMHLENFGGWLNYPDYYFFWCYLKGHLFNSSNYHSDEVAKLVDETLHIPVDDPNYAPKIKRLLAIAFDEVPRIPIWQPYLDLATSKDVQGYEYWFHRQIDARPLKLATS